jgi:alpha-tubulin suppressor-like RCC1 family protein
MTATNISLGDHHSCALLEDASVRCWGRNSYGQLGDGSTIDRSTPVEVSGITTATSISLEGYHACALLTGGTMKCWGSNNHGQLGDGTTIDRSTYPCCSVRYYDGDKNHFHYITVMCPAGKWVSLVLGLEPKWRAR